MCSGSIYFINKGTIDINEHQYSENRSVNLPISIGIVKETSDNENIDRRWHEGVFEENY